MTKKASMEQVLKYLGIKYATLNRLMRAHPDPSVAKKGTLRGQPFPAAEKSGRQSLFAIGEVRRWAQDNSDFYRRHKPSPYEITIPLTSFLTFLENYERSEFGTAKFDDDLNEIDVAKRDQYLLFESTEINGDMITLKFNDPDDAVWFKLKYS